MKLLSGTLISISIGLGLLTVSCSDESPWGATESGDGRIYLDVVADGNVTVGTRADEIITQAEVPAVSKFSVNLKSVDGTYNKTWETVDAFNKEEGFPMGNYTLSVFYGSENEQGFSKPYFYGESPVQVKLGATSDLQVKASLLNSMVSINYTEDLTSLYKAHSSVQSDGMEPLIYSYNETRPGYLKAGAAKLYLHLTNDSNDEVTVNPVDMNLEARHHYLVTFGVNKGENGQKTLSVEVTEDITQEEPLIINLTDELFNQPAPEVSANGFESGEQDEIFDSFPDEDSNPEFHVVALSGIKKATLNLTSSTNLPVVGGQSVSFELVGADETTKATLAELKLGCYGFFENVDRMAVVSLKDFIRILPEGEYTVSLVVTDMHGKTSDTQTDKMVIYKIKVNGLDYTISEVTQPNFLDKKITLKVKTNCSELKEKFSFLATDEEGDIVAVPASFKGEETEANTGYFIYTFELTTDPINDGQWTVQAKYDNKPAASQIVDVKMPDFTAETDAFAKRVKIRISEPTGTTLKASELVQYLNVKDGNGYQVESKNVDKSNANERILVVSGLTSNKEYSGYNLVLGKTKTKTYPVGDFNTEEELGVPNGGFEDLTQRYIGKEVFRGGNYTVTLASITTFQNTLDFTISEADNWNTSNSVSMNGKTDHRNNDNSWYNQPSVFNTSLDYVSTYPKITFLGGTYDQGGSDTPDAYKNLPVHTGSNAMVIQNVGYSKNGSTISTDRDTKSWGGYYNRTVPSDIIPCIGKMELDKYAFASRPSSLIGYYIYTPDNNDQNEYGVVNIQIFDKDGAIIASGNSELITSGDYAQFIIPLNYEIGNFNKASKISIKLSSSNYDSDDQVKLTTYNSQFETYKHGATLIVDDFEFVYE